jgi:hypothetical protein
MVIGGALPLYLKSMPGAVICILTEAISKEIVAALVLVFLSGA